MQPDKHQLNPKTKTNPRFFSQTEKLGRTSVNSLPIPPPETEIQDAKSPKQPDQTKTTVAMQWGIVIIQRSVRSEFYADEMPSSKYSVCVPSKECLSSWGIITVPIRKMQKKVYSLFREDQPVLKKERRKWVSWMMW